jgi:hypothetical protein
MVCVTINRKRSTIFWNCRSKAMFMTLSMRSMSKTKTLKTRSTSLNAAQKMKNQSVWRTESKSANKEKNLRSTSKTRDLTTAESTLWITKPQNLSSTGPSLRMKMKVLKAKELQITLKENHRGNPRESHIQHLQVRWRHSSQCRI